MYIYVYIYISIDLYLHIYLSIYVYIYIFIFIDRCVYIDIYIYIYKYKYVLYMCILDDIYIYIYISFLSKSRHVCTGRSTKPVQIRISPPYTGSDPCRSFPEGSICGITLSKNHVLYEYKRYILSHGSNGEERRGLRRE